MSEEEEDGILEGFKLPKIFRRPLVDAETGESISYIPAKWDSKEGVQRMNVDDSSSFASESSRGGSRGDSTFNDSFSERRNPLFEHFMKNGPIRSRSVASRLSRRSQSSSRQKSDEISSATSLTEGGLFPTSPFSPSFSTTSNVNFSVSADEKESRRSRRGRGRGGVQSRSGSPSTAGSRGGSRSSSRGSSGNSSAGSSRRTARTQTSAEEKRLRKAYFDELMETAGALKLSQDNRWRRFDETFASRKAVRSACRSIAKLRARQVTYVTSLVNKEEADEAERVRRERAVRSLPSRLADLKRLHAEERRAARSYIEQVRYQNEVVLLTRTREAGLLW